MRAPLPPMLVALTFATGIVDATAFLGLGGVFVGNMTGNVIFFGVALTGAGIAKTEATVVALVAFVVGAALARRLRLTEAGRGLHGVRRLLAVETLLIALAVALGLVIGVDSDAERLGIVSVLAIAMGLQNATVHALAVPDLTTTVVTQQLSGVGADAWNAGQGRERHLRRLAAIVAMLAGAVVAALMIRASVELALVVGFVALISVAALFTALTREEAPARSS